MTTVSQFSRGFPLTTAGHEMIPPIAKYMAIFQYKIIICQGQFSIISAFSTENFPKSWHFYCNSQYRGRGGRPPRCRACGHGAGRRNQGLRTRPSVQADPSMDLPWDGGLRIRHRSRRAVVSPHTISLSERVDRLQVCSGSQPPCLCRIDLVYLQGSCTQVRCQSPATSLCSRHTPATAHAICQSWPRESRCGGDCFWSLLVLTSRSISPMTLPIARSSSILSAQAIYQIHP